MAQLLSSLPVGTKVKDPGTTYNGKPIIFQVTAKNHPGYPVDSVTLLTERIITLKSFDAIEPGNTDANRRTNGNNRYLHSNIRQWLNKDTQPWYSAQHGADQPPTGVNVWSGYNPYDSERGFLGNFSAHFKNRILNTTLSVARNTVTDGGGSETVQDKVFLLSNTEVGFANENGISEGSRLALFSNDASRQANPTAEAVSKTSYTNSTLSATRSWHWWLRTPFAGESNYARGVHSAGLLHYYAAFYGHFGVRPALNLPSEIWVSDNLDADDAYVITWNAVPTVTLAEVDGRTLYEGDTINLSGQAVYKDAGDVVSVKYSINNRTERTLAASVSDGFTPISYSKTLKFTNGKIFDGSIAVTDTLAEGVDHVLRLRAEDDKNGESTVQVRSFRIVANRPPVLQVDSFKKQTGVIESELMTVSGNVSDPDGNDVTLRYKLNGGSFVQVYRGASGPFDFTLSVSSLVDGNNTLTLQVEDTYNFTMQKTVAIQREFNGSQLTEAVARFALQPATAEAQGLVTWIEHDTAASLAVAVSMTDPAEQEKFEAMDKTNTVELIDNITEDEFDHIAPAPKGKIVLKLSISDGNIAKVSGAFQA
ncbi:hypothetical protein FJQ98_14045 [Lysinibacillus agricola]|uniref:DUF6273 domain-containing protein n=1 Tax=Lysinibacillus agricola TaxID=2590012 RepID=A0ABX7ALA1_9BACI|nr:MULTISPECIES: DUF6273 domain-containing protein [Lysinibacillus]QQP10409.1 hypothetical protein FJQ98_14045 [Lysinibacillus agricola]